MTLAKGHKDLDISAAFCYSVLLIADEGSRKLSKCHNPCAIWLYSVSQSLTWMNFPPTLASAILDELKWYSLSSNVCAVFSSLVLA